jgi:hypothetical protein
MRALINSSLAGMVVLLLLSGCGVGRHVQKGINAYNAMKYHQAMSIWIDLEQRVPDMNSKGVVRYHVFRGLTHYRIGDRAMAHRFLAEGQRAYQAGDPSWLPPQTVQEMSAAMATLQGGAPAAPAAAPGPGQPGPEPVPAPEPIE